MRKNRIYAFNTHYQIYDYTLGENRELERSLTYYDKVTHTSYPKFIYDKNEQTLFIPRGYDPFLLEQWNGKPIDIIENTSTPQKINFSLKLEPRDEDEEKAIRFLVGEEEFKSLHNASQKVLIMPTGAGKTFSAIAAIHKLQERALIIMRTQNLKEQWEQKFKQYTNMGGPNIVELHSSTQLRGYMKKKPSINQKVFISTRSLLISYCDRYGTSALAEVLDRMGIGIKVFDEAHQEYTRTLFLDYVTNVRRTFYLTATFQLSNYIENMVFQRSFNIVPKLKIKQNQDHRHIVYIAVLFNSHPNTMEDVRVTGKKRGFDRYAYIDYELEKGCLEKEVRYVMEHFLIQKKLEGKTLILSSKKATCDYFKEVSDSVMGGSVRSCSFHTDNRVEDYKGYDIISATSGMLGTGEDIPGIRFMLNTEPFASLPNADQFSGRLRPYDGGKKATFYVEFIDIGFPKAMEWYTRRQKILKKKAKAVHEMNHT